MIRLLLFVLLLAGCSETTRPEFSSVRLRTHVATEPGAVIFSAVATNASLRSIWHYAGCSAGQGIGFTIRDPAGDVVLIRDPYALTPACADGLEPLAPQASVTEGFRFDGTLYRNDPDPADRAYAAPSGRYTVLVKFGYATVYGTPSQVVTTTATFDW